MACPYWKNGGCGAEEIMKSALTGKRKEGGAIFYPTGQGDCREGFPECDSFKYVEKLK